MAEGQSFQQKWDALQPSKAAIAWSFAAGVAATIAIGFLWGGWVTGGSAREMRDAAVEEARAELAAVICVDRFMHSANAGIDLAALKEEDSWRRDNFIEEGGWVTLPGADGPVDDAADLCADRLVDMEVPPANAEAAAKPDAT
jgi:hypothetical protein